MKSYGRAPTFLMLTGYEQVRSVAAAIAGDWEAARDVRLVLPETGVCSIRRSWPSAASPAAAPMRRRETTGAACCGDAGGVGDRVVLRDGGPAGDPAHRGDQGRLLRVGCGDAGRADLSTRPSARWGSRWSTAHVRLSIGDASWPARLLRLGHRRRARH